jgi:ComF family protein
MNMAPSAWGSAAFHLRPGIFDPMRLRSVLSRWIGADCVFCGVAAGEPDVCRGCRQDFLAPRARCLGCAIPLPGHATLCGACLHRPPNFDATLALADYAAPVDGLILALKFGRRLELAPVLGALLATCLARIEAPASLLVPVPLAFERMAERGFNQSAEIGRAVAHKHRITLDLRLVLRIRHAPAQASLQLEARQRNVRGAFAVRRRLRGEHVVVIDDVMTTGSTLDEVARVLKSAGAARVTNCVIARTP